MPTRILIVDDHDVVRAGVRSILAAREEWSIVGEATNGRMAIEMAQRLRPDVIVMDITMPVMSGLDAAKEIAKQGLNAKVLVLSMHELRYGPGDLASLGIHGFVLKSNAVRDLVRALEALLGDGQFLQSSVPETPKGEPPSNPGSISMCWRWDWAGAFA
ncbi:MAG TPA: response regulator transcription factor [Candidatus Acidoferrales bacterium]|nr:response regulator transcription factor [Candidatus Acidoferrales bacterium]